MVVICPFGEVVGEFYADGISSGIFEVNDNQLFMFIRRLKQRGLFIIGLEPKNVAVLSLIR